MDHRNQIPKMLNDMNLDGIGVEVGVCEGNYSKIILKIWKGKKLYLIDSWRFIPDDIDFLNVDHNGQLNAMAQTFMKVYHYGTKVAIIREISIEAAKLFVEGSLDFCYIDASHSYNNVKNDLHAWYPKVKSGGVMAGHDYVDGLFKYPNGYVNFGVKKAVNEFFANKNITLSFTKEEISETLPSWYLIKP